MSKAKAMGQMEHEAAWAEKVNYWQTSRTAPGTWLERAAGQVEKAGGKVLAQGEGQEPQTGQRAYMLLFELDGAQFKVVWPVLPTKTNKDKAARIQAATALYYDVKARCVSSKFLGGRAAFFSYLILPDGRVAAQVAVPELMNGLPRLLTERLPG